MEFTTHSLKHFLMVLFIPGTSSTFISELEVPNGKRRNSERAAIRPYRNHRTTCSPGKLVRPRHRLAAITCIPRSAKVRTTDVDVTNSSHHGCPHCRTKATRLTSACVWLGKAAAFSRCPGLQLVFRA